MLVQQISRNFFYFLFIIPLLSAQVLSRQMTLRLFCVIFLRRQESLLLLIKLSASAGLEYKFI